MKRYVLTIFLIVLFCGTAFFSCAKDEENSEPGAIESFTEKTADEITNSIKTPINKARSAKTTSEDRMKDMDGMVKE